MNQIDWYLNGLPLFPDVLLYILLSRPLRFSFLLIVEFSTYFSRGSLYKFVVEVLVVRPIKGYG